MEMLTSVFRTGYEFVGIEPREGDGITLHLSQTQTFYDEPAFVLSCDLESYLLDRLQGRIDVKEYNEPGMPHSFIYHGTREGSDSSIFYAQLIARNNQRDISAYFSSSSEALSLHPYTDIPKEEQQRRMIEEYAQVFKYTKRAIARGRHLIKPAKSFTRDDCIRGSSALEETPDFGEQYIDRNFGTGMFHLGGVGVDASFDSVPRKPGEVVFDALKNAGVITDWQHLSPEHLQLMSETNQAMDFLRKIDEEK